MRAVGSRSEYMEGLSCLVSFSDQSDCAAQGHANCATVKRARGFQKVSLPWPDWVYNSFFFFPFFFEMFGSGSGVGNAGAQGGEPASE